MTRPAPSPARPGAPLLWAAPRPAAPARRSSRRPAAAARCANAAPPPRPGESSASTRSMLCWPPPAAPPPTPPGRTNTANGALRSNAPSPGWSHAATAASPTGASPKTTPGYTTGPLPSTSATWSTSASPEPATAPGHLPNPRAVTPAPGSSRPTPAIHQDFQWTSRRDGTQGAAPQPETQSDGAGHGRQVGEGVPAKADGI